MGVRNYFSVNSILLAFLWLFLLQCDDGPSKPRPYVSDYDIYLRGFLTSEDDFLIYKTKTGILIDSFPMSYSSRDPQVSADGLLLFLPGFHLTEQLAVVDAKTRSILRTVDVRGSYMAVSPDNRHIAIFGDSIHIVDITNYEVVYSDTTSVQPGRFNIEGDKLYCATSQCDILILDLATDPVTRTILDYPGFCPYLISSSIDDKILFALSYSGSRYRGFFEVYDTENDTILFQHELLTLYGHLDITPDGNYVVFAEIQEYISPPEDPPSPRTVNIFDARNLRMKSIIPTYGVDPAHPDGLAQYKFVITPDSRWYIGSGEGITVIDLSIFQLKRIIEGRWTYPISCRKIIK